MKQRESKSSAMKKCAVLLAASMLLATGCGQGEKTIDGNVQNIQPQDIGSDAERDTPETGQAGQDSQAPESGAGSGTQDHAGASGETGYTFSYNGTAIEMDADASPVLEKLGEPASYFEAASCAFEGLDKTYTYNGFELDTYPNGDKDQVSAVVLKDDSVATLEGICIGDSREKLLEAYPDGGTEECGMIIYKKAGMKLIFILQDDEVKSIEYRSTVLE